MWIPVLILMGSLDTGLFNFYQLLQYMIALLDKTDMAYH